MCVFKWTRIEMRVCVFRDGRVCMCAHVCVCVPVCVFTKHEYGFMCVCVCGWMCDSLYVHECSNVFTSTRTSCLFVHDLLSDNV